MPPQLLLRNQTIINPFSNKSSIVTCSIQFILQRCYFFTKVPTFLCDYHYMRNGKRTNQKKLKAINYQPLIIFYVFQGRAVCFPTEKHTALSQKTYGSRKGNIQLTSSFPTLHPYIFMFTNAFYTKSTARMPNPTATKVEISPGIINEWLSTYFPIRVVPVVSKLMAATTVG